MTFPYSGRDLVRPLQNLLRYLLSQQSDVHRQLKQYAHDSENDFVKWASQSPTEATAERNERARRYLVTMTRVRETELWLYECKRKRRQIWTLSIEQLADLYPVQIAPETTADELLKEDRPWTSFL